MVTEGCSPTLSPIDSTVVIVLSEGMLLFHSVLSIEHIQFEPSHFGIWEDVHPSRASVSVPGDESTYPFVAASVESVGTPTFVILSPIISKNPVITTSPESVMVMRAEAVPTPIEIKTMNNTRYGVLVSWFFQPIAQF